MSTKESFPWNWVSRLAAALTVASLIYGGVKILLRKEKLANSEEGSLVERSRQTSHNTDTVIIVSGRSEREVLSVGEDKRSDNFSGQTSKENSTNTKKKGNEFILNHSFLNSPQSKEVIVAIVNGENELVQLFSQEVSDIYAKKGFISITSIFSKSFFNSGKFEQVYTGNFDLLSQMRLERYTDYLALGKLGLSFRQNSIDNSMTTATATFELRLISVENGRSNKNINQIIAGAGWSNQEAEKDALNNLVSVLNNLL